MTVQAVPEGYHTLTPYMTVRDAGRAIEFYKQAFGAVEKGVMKGPDGKIMHAELRIGDSIFMLADIYSEDVDSAFDRAVKAGATVEMPVGDMFWGDRYGKLADPFGHKWSIATHKRDMSMEEIDEAQSEFMKQMPKSA